MFPGYHNKLKEIVYRDYLFRPPVIPEIKLSIGWAETLAGVPLSIPRDYQPNQIVKVMQKTITVQDDIQYQGKGSAIDPNLFPQTGYLGEGLADV